MKRFNEYIEINTEKRFGKPIIKGTRISVYDVLSWLSNGMTREEIIHDYPELSEKQINDLFPDSKQVREFGRENSTDFEIFEHAKRNDFAIVTFDSDFCDLHILKGFPPKTIWI
ncbi:MAG: DUF5615 family PIN-like protein [Bacteroidales bacterium]|nr:DUF5615 family PIN-like protein [Bacteroidales bacterium]